MKGKPLSPDRQDHEARRTGVLKILRSTRHPWADHEPFHYPGLALQQAVAENA